MKNQKLESKTNTSACTDAKIFDAQAAGETALTLFEKTLNGANIIHDLGYLNSAMTGSLELVAYCDEVIEWIKRYWQPFELTEESLACKAANLVEKKKRKKAKIKMRQK